MGSLQMWCNMDTSWRCCPSEGCLIWWNAWFSNLASVLKRKDQKWWRALQISGGFHILTIIYYLEMVESCSETTWTLCSRKKISKLYCFTFGKIKWAIFHLDTRSTTLKTHYITYAHYINQLHTSLWCIPRPIFHRQTNHLCLLLFPTH